MSVTARSDSLRVKAHFIEPMLTLAVYYAQHPISYTPSPPRSLNLREFFCWHGRCVNREATNMKKHLLFALGSTLLFGGLFATQGCSDSDPYGYRYGGPGYYSGGYYGGGSWRDRDINNDAYAIQRGQAAIQHDKHELHGDLEHGNYGAAAHEQEEIQQRRSNIRARQNDLNSDLYGY